MTPNSPDTVPPTPSRPFGVLRGLGATAITLPRRTLVWLAVLFALWCGAVLLFVELAGEVATRDPMRFDRPVVEWIGEHRTGPLTFVAEVVTQLGGVVAVPIVGLMLAGLLWLRRRRVDAVFLAVAMIGSALMNVLLKAVFQRERPDFWLQVVAERGHSFPSGHAMGSATLVVALVLLARGGGRRIVVICAGVVYALLVGASRVYLGVHYPTDVVAGWAVSIVWVLGVAAVITWHGAPGWGGGVAQLVASSDGAGVRAATAPDGGPAASDGGPDV